MKESSEGGFYGIKLKKNPESLTLNRYKLYFNTSSFKWNNN